VRRVGERIGRRLKERPTGGVRVVAIRRGRRKREQARKDGRGGGLAFGRKGKGE